MLVEKVGYKFLFSAPGEEVAVVRHETRPGDAENCARKLAKLVAKKLGWAEARCIWMGPATEEIPKKIKDEIRRERVS